jgi:NADPH:quinone reductase-like Zn-dependent oxidoreductase
MRALRLHEPGGIDSLSLDEVPAPVPGLDEALVQVHAAAITRGELSWPVDRLPAIPSYELAGAVVASSGAGDGPAAGEAVFALAPFDRDGAAAELVAVPAGALAPKPPSLDDVAAAALPLAGLTAWQALFDHGRLQAGERVLIQGAAGGVGHLAVQLAHGHGAHVAGTASAADLEAVRGFGADEALDRDAAPFAGVEPFDLVFDTVGGDMLAAAPALLRAGGRIVTIAEQPPPGVEAHFFIVEPDGAQLGELSRLVEAGELRPEIGAVFPLEQARAAFERVESRTGRGKVVLTV